MRVQLALQGQDKDLGGGFVVRRLLPAAQRQSVGPFLFFGHFGPVTVTVAPSAASTPASGVTIAA